MMTETKDDEALIEIMARDLCIQDGHDPDDMRGGFNQEPIWKSWAIECRSFFRTYLAMLKAIEELDRREAAEFASRLESDK